MPSRRTGRLIALSIAALVFSTSTAARAWQARLSGTGSGEGSALAVTAAPGGDVVAGGFIDQTATGADFAVVRLASADGSELWRTVLAGPAVHMPPNETDEAVAVAIDPAGDVIAAGRTSSPGVDSQLTVVKLNGATGAIRWRQDAPATFQEPVGLAVDPSGDVFVATTTVDPMSFESRMTLRRHAAQTGLPSWTYTGVQGEGVAVALHPSGDPVLLGRTLGTFLQGSAVARVDQATGMEVWATMLQPPSGEAKRLLVSAAGDVYVGAGNTGSDFMITGTISLLSGTAGQPSWTHEVRSVDDATVLGNGDVAVLETSTIQQGQAALLSPHTLWVERLAHDDGTLVADHEFPRDPGNVYPCPCGARGRGAALVLDPSSGDLFVVGSYRDFGFLAARLAAADLHELWRREGGETPDVPGWYQPRGATRTANGTLAVGGGHAAVLPGTGPSSLPTFTVTTFAADDGAPLACGDGTVDAGEMCDDGNFVGGDCCAADCKTAAAEGSACDDGSVCTLGDACHGGICAGSSELPCAPCGECSPTNGCLAEPTASCGRSMVSGGGRLAVDRPRSSRGSFLWTLRSGPATTVANLGDPRAAAGYAVCGITESGRVVLRATAPAGGCGAVRCWRRTRHGFEYRDARAPDGLSRLSLRAGAGGQSRFEATGGGKHAVVPDLPATESVRIELRRLDAPDRCWAADHGTVRRNTPRHYRAMGE
ncbi:MAG TPA: PQQ-binding-like beta-propeller repeat protein [Candidatus Eisenbacteria bacterium]|nr:PQQ-binding-like beta-propeller repeat protein [Candidatus Eisenbacteria bacterium]